MKLTTSNEILAENKAIILYILNKINEPVTENELLKLTFLLLDMNYFYFKQFLLDLIQVNYIDKYIKDEQIFYILTAKGKTALDLTANIIPGIIKLKIDDNIKSYRNNIQNELSVIADFEPDEKNNFIVNCKIIENNKIIFSVKILVGSIEQAKNICNNWQTNTKLIYPSILNILTKNGS